MSRWTRLASAAVLGCLVAGLVEGLRAGGGAAGALVAVGLCLWAAPLVLATIAALVALWTGPALTAARAPAGRAAGLAALLLGATGLLALRIGTGRLVATFVDAAREPALIAPAAAAVAVGLAAALGVCAVAGFGPVRGLVSRLGLDRPAPAAALVASSALLVAWAGLPPALEVARDISPWPLVTLGIAVVVGAGSTPLLPRRLGAHAAVIAVGAALAVAAPTLVADRPAVEQALADGQGFAGLLAGRVIEPEPVASVEPPPPASPDAPAGEWTPPPVDEGPPMHHGPLPPGLDRRWNVLVVTIDAVRADHLPLYGHPRDTAPHLSALGARSAVFERAYTSVNATRWLIQSLFTGRAPADIDQVHAGYYVLLQPGSGHIFERWRRAGWHTEAHNSAHLRTAMWFGLEAGFDVYAGHDEAHLRGESADVLAGAFEGALDRLAGDADRPWALWLHLLEPHEPYIEHPAFPFGDAEIDRYDAEIAAADAGLGRMLRALDARGLADSTIVVVTSDHGEEFGEHGRKFHGKQLYEESIRVPLVIHVPGLAPRRLAAPVSLIDVAPTLAHLTGLPPARSPGLDGHRARSLVGVMAGGPEDTGRAVFVDCIVDPEHFAGRRLAMVRGHDKVIVDRAGVDGRQARFYDLAADPAEATNLRFTDPERYAAAAAPLQAELDRRRENLRARLLRRHVSTTPPAGLTDPPIAVRPGLELLGSRVDTLPWLDRRLPLLRTWFRVTAPQPDLVIRHEYLDEAGRRLKHKQYRPLQGLHPTSAWRPGQVIEDLRMVRFRPAPRRYAQATLTVLERGRPIFGPHPLGRLVPDARTVGAGDGPSTGPDDPPGGPE